MRVLGLLLFVFVAGAGAQALPEGKGKEIMEGTCSECHGPDEVVGRAWTAERWRALVGQMVNKGADLSDEQRKTLIDYLVENFGPVNVNKATAKDLQTTLGLSGAESDTIVRYRQTHGNFKGWDDFSNPGINAAKLEGIRDSVVFQ